MSPDTGARSAPEAARMQPDVLAVLTAALPTTAWLLAVAAAFVTLDAVLPVLPSETALVTVGVLAATKAETEAETETLLYDSIGYEGLGEIDRIVRCHASRPERGLRATASSAFRYHVAG